MVSIRKIALIPIKWAFKKLLKKTILTFPHGDSHADIVCVYCPEMCRFACPVATTTGNDVFTPCNKISFLYKRDRWPEFLTKGELWPIYGCTGCGRCTEYCKYGVPVADKIFKARRKFVWEKAKQLTKEKLSSDLLQELGILDGNFNYVESKLGAHICVESSSRLEAELKGRRWLVHESVWSSRRAEQYKSVAAFVTSLQAKGIDLIFHHHSGRDCLDCGGEGAYKSLFPEDARKMACDIWRRDRERVDGIFTLSSRCADHFRKSLGSKTPVIWAGDFR